MLDGLEARFRRSKEAGWSVGPRYPPIVVMTPPRRGIGLVVGNAGQPFEFPEGHVPEPFCNIGKGVEKGQTFPSGNHHHRFGMVPPPSHPMRSVGSKPKVAADAGGKIGLAPMVPFSESREKEVLPGQGSGQTLCQSFFEARARGDPQEQPRSQLRRGLFDEFVVGWIHRRRMMARRPNASRSGAASRASATAPLGPRVEMGRSVVFPGMPRKGGGGTASRKEARDEFTSLERRTTGWSVVGFSEVWEEKERSERSAGSSLRLLSSKPRVRKPAAEVVLIQPRQGDGERLGYAFRGPAGEVILVPETTEDIPDISG